MILLIGVGLVLALKGPPGSKVSHQGRKVDAWFGDLMKSDWNNPLSDVRTNLPAMAFREMEGDAVPFLAYRCAWGYSPFQRGYALFLKRLPLKVRTRLPSPRPDPRGAALWLLGGIGQAQQTKAWQGKPSGKLSVQAAMPAIRKALQDRVLRSQACQTIGQIGIPASQAVPDLVRLAAADYLRKELDPAVIGALGQIGSSASNAVPLLSAIAADQAVRSRWLAVRALGDIGPWARPAAPVLGTLLAKQGAVNDFALLTAVARIGDTPKEAVPVLQQVLARGNPLCQVMASVALWNYEPTNPEFQKNVSAFLQASLEEPGKVAHPASADSRFLAGPLLATLRVHGTNAAVFAPIIRQLVQCGYPSLTNLAAITLQQIEPVTPHP